jgi:hypothetical protein
MGSQPTHQTAGHTPSLAGPEPTAHPLFPPHSQTQGPDDAALLVHVQDLRTRLYLHRIQQYRDQMDGLGPQPRAEP